MRFFLLLMVAVLSPQVMAAQMEPAGAEQALLRLANEERAARGLPGLRWDGALAQAAEAHLEWMMQEQSASSGELLHQYRGERDLTARAAEAGARFSTVSENLGARGESPLRLEQKWMSTAVHRATLLDPELNVVGIAVAERDGLLYAVEDFGRYVPVERNADIEREVARRLQARGIGTAPATSNEDARRTCGMATGAAGEPKLVVQWDGANPAVLPDALLQELATGRYRTAAVGVCAGRQGGAFTTYHVAVLLY